MPWTYYLFHSRIIRKKAYQYQKSLMNYMWFKEWARVRCCSMARENLDIDWHLYTLYKEAAYNYVNACWETHHG